MHPPGWYFFYLENPERKRAEDHCREKQNFCIEPDDAQGIRDENAETDREPRPSLAEKNGNRPDTVGPVALDVFQIFDGKRNRERDDQKPKSLMRKTGNILPVGEKYEATGK